MTDSWGEFLLKELRERNLGDVILFVTLATWVIFFNVKLLDNVVFVRSIEYNLQYIVTGWQADVIPGQPLQWEIGVTIFNMGTKPLSKVRASVHFPYTSFRGGEIVGGSRIPEVDDSSVKFEVIDELFPGESVRFRGSFIFDRADLADSAMDLARVRVHALEANGGQVESEKSYNPVAVEGLVKALALYDFFLLGFLTLILIPFSFFARFVFMLAPKRTDSISSSKKSRKNDKNGQIVKFLWLRKKRRTKTKRRREGAKIR